MLNKYALTAALQNIGQAQLAIGDPFTSGGMAMLGLTEGELTADISHREYDITAEDYTAGIPHQVSTNVDSAVITIPLIVTNKALLVKVSATGEASGGYSSPQPVQETSALLIPEKEVGAGLSYNPAATTPAWSPAAPNMAVWFWRCYLTHGAIPYRVGTNTIVEVRVRAMLYAPNPEGHKVFTIGDPIAEGITVNI